MGMKYKEAYKPVVCITGLEIGTPDRESVQEFKHDNVITNQCVNCINA